MHTLRVRCGCHAVEFSGERTHEFLEFAFRVAKAVPADGGLHKWVRSVAIGLQTFQEGNLTGRIYRRREYSLSGEYCYTSFLLDFENQRRLSHFIFMFLGKSVGDDEAMMKLVDRMNTKGRELERVAVTAAFDRLVDQENKRLRKQQLKKDKKRLNSIKYRCGQRRRSERKKS